MKMILITSKYLVRWFHCFVWPLRLLTAAISLVRVIVIHRTAYDARKLATHVYEDSYLVILDIDGPEWADKLRYRMHDKSVRDLSTEQSWLLAKHV